MDNITFTQQGWECPRCGQINAPWMPYCTCKKSVTFSWVKDTSTTSKPTTETMEWSETDSKKDR